MKKILLGTLLVLAAMVSQKSYSWGQTGHRVVGEIAEHRLTTTARKRLKKILSGESLARASTWGDEVRSDPKYAEKSAPWHYVTIADGKSYGTPEIPKEGDALTAMIAMEAILRDKSSSLKSQQEALRYMTHFLGDVHQPLHVGNGKDRGGNLCSVKWMYKRTNLHTVWDSSMIDFLNLSFTEFVRFLEDKLSRRQEAVWASGSYLDWIKESQDLRDSIYPDGSSVTKADSERFYCNEMKDDSKELESIPSLGYEYAYQHRALLDTRLSQAGVRLAYVLNAIFSQKKFSAYRSAL